MFKRSKERENAWPAFVDLFSNLVIILIFLLIVFIFLYTMTNVFSGPARENTKAKVAELEQVRADQELELKNLAERELQSQQVIMQVQHQAQQLDLEREQLRSELEQIRMAMEQMQMERDQTRADIVRYQQQVQDLEMSEADLNNLVMGLEGKIMESDAALRDREEQKRILTDELAKLNAALAESDERAREQEVQFVEMSTRLNRALANKMAEYMEYQSEFFKAMKMSLGGMDGIDISDDRFVLPTEILFASGSAELEPVGRTQLIKIANVIRTMEIKIPAGTPWIIRVDGHTDIKPVKPGTKSFKNNRELSLARAMSVTKFLQSQGVDKSRLIPSGFGEMYPISSGNDEMSLRQNRRIEFRLTNP